MASDHSCTNCDAQVEMIAAALAGLDSDEE
jgi:hypothetical protein